MKKIDMDLSECHMVKIYATISICYEHPISTHREAPCNIQEAAGDFNDECDKLITDHVSKLRDFEPFHKFEVNNVVITRMESA